jgi:hypothetical protein
MTCHAAWPLDMAIDFSCFFTLSKEEKKKERNPSSALLEACSGSPQQSAVMHLGRGDRRTTLVVPNASKIGWQVPECCL